MQKPRRGPPDGGSGCARIDVKNRYGSWLDAKLNQSQEAAALFVLQYNDN